MQPTGDPGWEEEVPSTLWGLLLPEPAHSLSSIPHSAHRSIL